MNNLIRLIMSAPDTIIDDLEEVQAHHHTPSILEARQYPSEQDYFRAVDQDHAYQTIDHLCFLAHGGCSILWNLGGCPCLMTVFNLGRTHMRARGGHRSLESEYLVPLQRQRELVCTEPMHFAYAFALSKAQLH